MLSVVSSEPGHYYHVREVPTMLSDDPTMLSESPTMRIKGSYHVLIALSGPCHGLCSQRVLPTYHALRGAYTML